jgi:uncharacterized membrane protein HdeD (DUF308 family)
MNWGDLIRDAGTGMASHTKLWANAAYASGTASFLWGAFHGGQPGEIWIIYLGIVGASATASKFLSLRYGANPDPETKPDASA